MTSVPSDAAAPPLADIVHLSKRYRDITAVDDVSFSLRAGTITGILGPNGAGKTSTLRMLLGLAAPSSGDVWIDGQHVGELAEPWRHVGAVLESVDFHPARSGRDHLRVLARLCGIDDAHVDELLGLVGLADAAHRRVGGYSLGMRQRLGLAGALLGEPRLLVLDEPTNGLDPLGVRWMRELMRSFADGGGAVVLSSHLLSEVAHTADRILIIDRGRLRADAPTEELVAAGDDLEDVYFRLVGTGVPS